MQPMHIFPMTMTKKERARSRYIAVPMTPSELEDLKKRAHEEQTSMARFVRTLIGLEA